MSPAEKHNSAARNDRRWASTLRSGVLARADFGKLGRRSQRPASARNLNRSIQCLRDLLARTGSTQCQMARPLFRVEVGLSQSPVHIAPCGRRGRFVEHRREQRVCEADQLRLRLDDRHCACLREFHVDVSEDLLERLPCRLGKRCRREESSTCRLLQGRQPCLEQTAEAPGGLRSSPSAKLRADDAKNGFPPRSECRLTSVGRANDDQAVDGQAVERGNRSKVPARSAPLAHPEAR